MSELHCRKKNRLGNYDYSRNGAYFVTICTKDRQYLFWDNTVKYNKPDPVGANFVSPLNSIELSEYGNFVKNEIEKILFIYNDVIIINKYVIMPNHIHMIVIIDNLCEGSSLSDGRTQFAPTVSRLIKQFKGSITKQIGFPIWQKSFHDRIIRNEKEYSALWNYIEYNPVNWENDSLFTK